MSPSTYFTQIIDYIESIIILLLKPFTFLGLHYERVTYGNLWILFLLLALFIFAVIKTKGFPKRLLVILVSYMCMVVSLFIFIAYSHSVVNCPFLWQKNVGGKMGCVTVGR